MPPIDGLRRKTHRQTHLESGYLQPRVRGEAGAVDLAAAVNEPAPHPTSFADLHPRRKKVTMIGVILAMLLAALDQTIVGTALPRIATEFGAADHLIWVVTAYMLASTVTVPIYGKLSDLFGRKWFFFWGIVIFLVASMLSGQAHNMPELIIFRALQGIGGGAIMGNAFAIIADLFEPAERARWQGALGGIFGLSSVIGPALGGWLTDHASWRWVFYVNLPVGLVALAVIAFLMPKVVPHTKSKIIDFWGAGALILTLVPLLSALSFGGRQYAWGSAIILSLFATAAAGLVLFLWAERRSPDPIIPLSLFRSDVFTISAVITFLTGAAMFGAIVYIPLFGQFVQGVSATDSGSILTPLMVGLIGASIVTGQVIARTGKYRWLVLAGTSLLTLSLLWLSTLGVGTSRWELVARMVALGLGLGAIMPVFNIVVQSAFDSSKIGVVTASMQLARSIGGTVGTAIFGAFFNNALADRAKDLGSTTFGQTAAHSAKALNVADPNILQFLLSEPGRAQIAGELVKLPAAYHAAAQQAYTTYLDGAKAALTGSVNYVFLVAAVTSGTALVLALFLREIPLRGRAATKPKHSAATEAGDELASELGVAQPKDEPVLLR
ncbi:MAG TPA: MDR family MFS transporter [Candidatus Saccharimonadia bacterium]